jgi:hypothetical protein
MLLKKVFLVYDEAGHAPLLSPRHPLQIDDNLERT